MKLHISAGGCTPGQAQRIFDIIDAALLREGEMIRTRGGCRHREYDFG